MNPTTPKNLFLFLAAAALLMLLPQTIHHAYAFLTNPVSPITQYQSAGTSQFISAGTLASATPLTLPTTIQTPTSAMICVETAGVRYRDDGTAPTASVGIPLVPVSSTVPTCNMYFGPLSKIQFIAISGSPTMDISYYYQGNI